MSIEKIVSILEKSNITHNKIINKYGSYDILLTYQLKSYLVQMEDDNIKLLEFNIAGNSGRKNRYHFLDKFSNVGAAIDFIKTRKFYMIN